MISTIVIGIFVVLNILGFVVMARNLRRGASLECACEMHELCWLRGCGDCPCSCHNWAKWAAYFKSRPSEVAKLP